MPFFMSSQDLDDVRIRLIQPLIPPDCMMDDLPLDEKWVDFIASTREQIAAVLSGQDDRLVVLVGPDCIHDTHGAMAYATMLSKAKQVVVGAWLSHGSRQRELERGGCKKRGPVQAQVSNINESLEELLICTSSG